MRRFFSVILFVLGGWALMAEPFLAFLDFGSGLEAGKLAALAIALAMAAVPLAAGTALSPGERWRELGLTILLATGFAAFAGVSAAAIFLDPGARPIVEAVGPMPDFRLAPVVGILNLIVILAAGWLLFRRQGETDQTLTSR